MTSTTSHSKRTERRPRKGTVMATQLKKLLCSLLALTLSATSISVAAGTTVRYVHTDALGTPIAVTDESGNVIERSEYEPYGALLNRPIETEPGYTGHVQDAATGLTYMQQRYYDPQIGMFLSVDPVTAYEQPVGQFNRYRYANGNPYGFTDPDGRFGWIVAGAAIGGAIGGGVNLYSQMKSGKSLSEVNWKKVGTTALKGAVTGAVASSGAGAVANLGGGLLAQAAIGTAAGTLESSLANGAESEFLQDERSGEEYLVDTLAGGVGSGVASPIKDPITSAAVASVIEEIVQEVADEGGPEEAETIDAN